jgi:hypothetical protein
MIKDNRAVGGMRIGGGNTCTRRKLPPVALCPPQIPHDLTLDPLVVSSLCGINILLNTLFPNAVMNGIYVSMQRRL